MAYFEVTDFKAGVDVRRSRYTSVPGTLQKLVNAHITRGGDVERRKAFVNMGDFGGNTFGLDADDAGLVTFGSAAEPGASLPSGVRYQRLAAPSGATMLSVDATEQFGGKVYVAATYSDGVQWHFYDGKVVGDWGGGTVRDYMANMDGVAQSLANIINGGGIYTATASGSTVTVSGPDGVDYEVVGSTQGAEGGPADQEIIISGMQYAATAIPAARAVAAFTITAGKEGPGNAVERVTVNPGGAEVQLLAAPVAFTINSRETAAAVAAAINNLTASHGHTARADFGGVLISAPIGSGSDPNGLGLEVEASGEVCLANASIRIGAGGPGGTDKILSIRVNGLPVMVSAVPWETSNSETALVVAGHINAHASIPKMVATAIGESVYLAPKVVRSSDPSSMTVLVITDGELVAEPGVPPPEGPPGGGGGGYDPRRGPISDIPIEQL